MRDAGAGIVKGFEHGVEGSGEFVVGMHGFDFGNGCEECAVPFGGVAADPGVKIMDQGPKAGGGDKRRVLVTFGVGRRSGKSRDQERERNDEAHWPPLYRQVLDGE